MSGLNSKYLRPADLGRLRHVFFTSRRAVAGQYAGRHASPQRGRSVEFTDYRQYLPGDPLADVDWKVYGRSDRLYLKLFEHQSEMSVNLLLDASASMAYAGSDPATKPSSDQGRNSGSSHPPSVARSLGRSVASTTKYDHAAHLAAAIAFLGIQQRDRVSFGVAQAGLTHFRGAGQSPNHLNGILHAMEQVKPAGAADLPAALREMIGAVPRRGLFIVMSDLLDDQDATLSALSLFSHRGGQVILFHVLHADELRLPGVGDAMFLDSEAPQSVSVSVDEVRGDYDSRMRQFIQSWSAACARRGFDYDLVSTATPYDHALEQYLFSRAARA